MHVRGKGDVLQNSYLISFIPNGGIEICGRFTVVPKGYKENPDLMPTAESKVLWYAHLPS